MVLFLYYIVLSFIIFSFVMSILYLRYRYFNDIQDITTDLLVDNNKSFEGKLNLKKYNKYRQLYIDSDILSFDNTNPLGPTKTILFQFY